MSTHFVFPKPRDWGTFEDIVCDVFARKFGSHNLQRYGRQGQRQSGIDVVGPTSGGLLGIQCKHHPTGNIPIAEIDDEIAKSDSFRPGLSEFIVATSADRDTNAHSHVLEVSKLRKSLGKHSVGIKFWDDIYSWLVEFPDLLYKHFTQYFPIAELEHIRPPDIKQSRRMTVRWPTTLEALNNNIGQTIGGVDRADPYQLTIGLSCFPDTSFDGIVDLEVSLGSLFSTTSVPEKGFLEASHILTDVKALVRDPLFSHELTVHLQARLTLAFLLGWVFRQTSHFDLRLIFRDQVWVTGGLPLVLSELIDGPPKLMQSDSNEIVLVLNISRQIDSSVLEFVHTWAEQPRAVLVYDLVSHSINSAAHALSLSVDVSQRIKSLIDRWGISRIHLFGAMPATLAALVGYHLNAICPISIYFMDRTRMQYVLGGTLINSI